MSCCTSCCKTLLLVITLLAMAALALPAFGQAGVTTQNCIQNEWNLAQGHSLTCTSSSCTLGCTANDVSIAKVVNVRNTAGTSIATCQQGNTFNFIADFEIKTTSKSSRSNIGLYIAETGTTVADALSVNNTCADNIIPPPTGFVNTNTTGKTPTIGANGHFLCAGSSTVLCGTDYYDELDQATTSPADNCGDSSSTDLGGFGTGTQDVTLEINGFQCPVPCTSPGVPAGCANLPTCTAPGTCSSGTCTAGKIGNTCAANSDCDLTGPCAVLPNCTSWQVPGQTTLCVSAPGAQGYPYNNNGVPEAVPGTSSKCNCGVITLPVIVQKPSATVSKACTTTSSPGLNTSCDSGTEGVEEVTYTVTITNTSNFGSLTLTQVTDSVYGTILGTGTFTGDGNEGCTSTTIAANSSVTCTFTAHKYGDPGTGIGQATVTDSASAAGTSGGGNWGPTTSNTVTVTPDQAPGAATVTKGLGSPQLTAGCATANFTVDVKNTSNQTATVAGTCTSGTCTTGVVGKSCSVNADCTATVTLDETESLTGLSDSAFGNITSVQGSVNSTTCGVATGSGGPGTLPASLSPGADYSCGFNASFCGTLQTVEEFTTGACDTSTGACSAGHLNFCAIDADCGAGGTCTGGACTAGKLTSCSVNSDCDLTCTGLTHKNTVTATISGDEAGDVVTPTGNNTLTVNVCLNPFTQASP